MVWLIVVTGGFWKVSPGLHTRDGLVCVFPAADSTTKSEPLSAPSSQHPLRKEAGQAALVPCKPCTAISCRDTGYFWTQGGSRYDYEKTPQTGNHPARHPAAPAFLALSLTDWALDGDSAPCADSDQREESPAEQESHLLFNSGWPLPPAEVDAHTEPISPVWHEYITTPSELKHTLLHSLSHCLCTICWANRLL